MTFQKGPGKLDLVLYPYIYVTLTYNCYEYIRFNVGDFRLVITAQ